MGVCEENCDFISYNTETGKAVCSCGIKTEIPFMDNVKIDKDVLLNSFTDISNIANTKMMTCYKTVFQIKNILKNIGFFIYASLIILNLLLLLYFLIKDYKKLKKKINTIRLSNSNDKNNIKNKKVKNRKKIEINFEKNKRIENRKSSERKLSKKKIINFKRNSVHISKNINRNNSHLNKKKENIIQLKNNNSIKNVKENKSNKPILFCRKKSKKELSAIKKKILISNLNIRELNSMTYKNALLYDKRTFIDYYFSLLKSNHIVLYIFYHDDYNSTIIKLSLLIFNLATYISVNSLFFNDSTMHKIYTDHGSFNFIYQLPQIIYSAIISAVLNSLIKLIGLTEANVLKMKKMTNINQKFKNLFIIIKIKFTIFFIMNFLFLSLFCYYVTCFCGIYRNTQTHLLKDSLFSFITSLLTPFGIYLVPAMFRILALKYHKKYLYRFSKLLQML